MGKDDSGTIINTSAYVGRLLESIPASYTIFKIGSDYYAECNATNGTDYGPLTNASTVIRAALDASTSGDKLFFKNAEYTLSENIGNITEGLIWEGESRDGVILKATHTGELSEILYFLNAPGTVVRNMTLDCNDRAYRGFSFNRETGQDANNLIVDNVAVLNQPAASDVWAFIVWDWELTRELMHVSIKNLLVKDCAGTTHENFIVSNCRDVYLEDIRLDTLGKGGNIYHCQDVEAHGITCKDVPFFKANHKDILIEGLIVENGYIEIRDAGDASLPTSNITLVNPRTNRLMQVQGHLVGVDELYVERVTLINPIAYDHPSSFGIGILDYTKDCEVIAPKVYGCYTSGIHLGGVRTKVIGGTVKNNVQGGGLYSGIRNDAGEDSEIISCDIFDDQDIPTQTGAIRNVSGNIKFWQGGQITGTVNIVAGSIDKIRDVKGYVTENSGTATIGNGTETTGNIAHGLAGTPTVVFGMGSTTDTEDLYCDSKDATNIVIKCVGAVGGDRTIYWHAEYTP
jgi:hypothetical protein